MLPSVFGAAAMFAGDFAVGTIGNMLNCAIDFVTSDYPTGGLKTGLLSGFSNIH